MKTLQRCKFIAMSALALLTTIASAIEPKSKPETPVLSADAYRIPLEEVIVTGRSPYWQQKAPRWDKPKVEAPEAGPPSRLELAPHYTREERDEYNGIRDTQNPQPRTKLFELKF